MLDVCRTCGPAKKMPDRTPKSKNECKISCHLECLVGLGICTKMATEFFIAIFDTAESVDLPAQLMGIPSFALAVEVPQNLRKSQKEKGMKKTSPFLRSFVHDDTLENNNVVNNIGASQHAGGS